MSFAVVKFVPQSVTTIGDDGKNKSSHLFDKSLDTRWSYKGRFAYNIVTLEKPISLDSLVFHWYMKKKERRLYRFGVYLSEEDINIPSADFETTKNLVQGLYNDESKTVKSSNGEGDEITTMKFDSKLVKSFIVIYTYSSSKKSWFSVKEIEINGKIATTTTYCPDGTRYDPVSNDCKPIMNPEDDHSFDANNVLLFDDEVGDYISENHSFTRNFNKDGSMSIDISLADMGGKWRADTDITIFLQVSGKDPAHEVSCRMVGGPYEVVSMSFDAKKIRYRQEVEGGTNKLEEIDISGLSLPDMRGIWYGLTFLNRRIMCKNSKGILGRLLSLKVNPMPFDINRNVQNQNWVDVATFLDWDHDLIAEPKDRANVVESITTDGSSSSTYGFRYLRHCEIQPIEVSDEDEMHKLYKAERADVDEDEEEKITTINQEIAARPKLIAPKYPSPLGDFEFFTLVNQDSALEMLNGTIHGKFKNIEVTAILNFTKTASGYFGIMARGNYHAMFHAKGESVDGIGKDIVTRVPEDFSNYLMDVPSFRNKKVGLKWCLRNVKQYGEHDEEYEYVISEAFLCMDPTDPTYEYTPWWKAVYKKDNVNDATNVEVRWDNLSDFTTDAFEVREIESVPEIRRL